MNPGVLLVFVDGLGVGERDPAKNPLARLDSRNLCVFRPEAGAKGVSPEGGGVPEVPSGGFVPWCETPRGPCPGLDPLYGTPGLPQSATGQTALLTGVDAAALLGRHLFGFPNKRLREVILERSLLKRVAGLGLRAAFLNAYRPLFFDLGEAVWTKPLSVTTWANRAAGLPFFTLLDVAARRAVYQEFTNRQLRERGFDVPLFSPEEAGGILGRRTADFDFLLFEYFQTDLAGHSQNMDRCLRILRELDRFLDALLNAVDLERTLVIVTSDHGNIEDLSVRTHALNPALTILWGPGAGETARRISSIRDVPGAVLHRLGGGEE